MTNHWVTSGDQFAGWVADFTSAAPTPAQLIDWMCDVITAGERAQILRYDEAPLIDYDRSRDGPLVDVLRHRLETSGVADVGHFASSGVAVVPAVANGPSGSKLLCAGRVAYEDRGGSVVEEEVTDLGALLGELRPELGPEAGPFMIACPTVQLSGPLVGGDPATDPRWIRVSLAIRTDIYFPWVIGPFDTERFDPDARFDNHQLADRHTPRLNAFLAVAQDATRRLGGRWELDDEQRFTLPGLLTDAGIDLTVQPRPA